MPLENPFEDEEVAKQWADSVENDIGGTRGRESYPYIKEWFNNTNKGVIVDIGSGQGLCCEVVEGYTKYIGVEPSVYLTQRAKELYAAEDREFIIGNAYDIPLEDTSCDNAISINVWFHIEDIEKATSELSRILKSGGKFLIHTADNDSLPLWQSFYTNLVIDEKKMVGEFKHLTTGMKTNIFYLHTNQEIIDTLEKNNLHVTKTTKLGKKGDYSTFVIFEGEKNFI